VGETYFQYNTCEKEGINGILVQIPGKEFRVLGTYVRLFSVNVTEIASEFEV
jgi:hypothetical protein